jgi:hypothetical protein
MSDKLMAAAHTGASILMNTITADQLVIEGRYLATCISPDGQIRWEDDFSNTVVYVGQNLMLTSALQGSAYTVTGPYMGLISSVGYTAVSVSDTMTSHTGWTEAGNTNAPTFAARLLAVFGSAASGVLSLSAPLSFTMTGAGSLVGAFIVYGTGAVATIDSTAGTLFSAGPFTGGTRAVFAGDVVNVSYSITL